MATTYSNTKKIRTYLLIILSEGIGGGSLILYFYFLIFGTPLPIAIAQSNVSRLTLDAILCLSFFFQHSGMIRRGAKDQLAKQIPDIYHPALYSIASGIALIALVLFWQPTTVFLFHLPAAARWISSAIVLLAVAGFTWGVLSLQGFDTFGTQLLKAALRGDSSPSSPFVARGPYRYVRHPLYLFMLMIIWSTPRFSTDQLLFNALWTAWVIVGSKLEERDLIFDFGQVYRDYQAAVPMLIPSPRSLLRQWQSRNHT